MADLAGGHRGRARGDAPRQLEPLDQELRRDRAAVRGEPRQRRHHARGPQRGQGAFGVGDERDGGKGSRDVAPYARQQGGGAQTRGPGAFDAPPRHRARVRRRGRLRKRRGAHRASERDAPRAGGARRARRARRRAPRVRGDGDLRARGDGAGNRPRRLLLRCAVQARRRERGKIAERSDRDTRRRDDDGKRQDVIGAVRD